MGSAEVGGAAIFIAGAAALIYRAKAIAASKPTAEEQAWLDKQLATPKNPNELTLEEQSWLDKQMKDTEDADMLDDARQAGMLARQSACVAPQTPIAARVFCHAPPRCAAFAPGEGSSPVRVKAKGK